MATNPRIPAESRPERRPGPELVEARITHQQRTFKWFMLGAAVLVAAVVILVAVWLLKYGGGSPQEQPKPKQPTATPSGQVMPLTPRLQPQRPPLYAWAKK